MLVDLGTAFKQVGTGAQVLTMGNNLVRGNSANGSGTIGVFCAF